MRLLPFHRILQQIIRHIQRKCSVSLFHFYFFPSRECIRVARVRSYVCVRTCAGGSRLSNCMYIRQKKSLDGESFPAAAAAADASQFVLGAHSNRNDCDKNFGDDAHKRSSPHTHKHTHALLIYVYYIHIIIIIIHWCRCRRQPYSVEGALHCVAYTHQVIVKSCNNR